MSKILVAIPIKPSLNSVLAEKCFSLASRLPLANPGHEFVFHFDSKKVEPDATDNRAWSKVARARNRILHESNWNMFDYVLWIDADVVDYPADMPTRLIQANPTGVSAPLVLVEGTKRMYDWAACIMKGRGFIRQDDPSFISSRNLCPDFPYWEEEQSGVVEMDCVGTITMVYVGVYTHKVLYENHPSMTDHFPICKAAIANGRQVTIDTGTIAYHADLSEGKYPGESWH